MHRAALHRRAIGTAPRRGLAMLMVLLVGAGLTLVGVEQADAAITTPFAQTFNTNANGAIVLRGNASLTCTAAPACTTAQDGTATGGALNNNGYVMTNVDVDGDGTTFNSSSANLSLPTGSTVLFAGLYWGADTSAGTSGAAAPNATIKNQVRMRYGTGAYGTVTAARVSDPVTGRGAYQAFADVTSSVLGTGNGTYTVADIQAGTGEDRYAGWSLVIAYRNLAERMRNLVIYDGFGVVANGDPSLTIGVTGFTTPATGAVITRIGTVVYEGDRGLTGDSLSLNGTALFDGKNPIDNFFNSTATEGATSITARNPSYDNLMGVDIDQYDASGLIANGATSATLALGTGGETFYPGVVTFSTDLYSPLLNATLVGTDVDGGTLVPGDELLYTFTVANNGTDDSIESVLTDAIPAGTTYVPGSLAVGGVSKSDTPGNDTAAFGSGSTTFYLGTGATGALGGELAPNASTTFTYRVRIDNNTPGGTTILNTANLSYKGKNTGSVNANPSDSSSVTVLPPTTDLRVTAQATPPTVQKDNVDDAVSYDVTVLNNGPNLEPDATVTLTLPTGVTAGTLPGGCSAAGQVLTCALGTLSSGGSVVTTIPATVGATAAFSSAATAHVTGTGTDPTPANNTTTATVVVNTAPTAGADADSTTNGTAKAVPVLANDTDPDSGDTRSVTATTQPSHGAVTTNGTTVTYTPTLGYRGADSFTYTVTDAHGGTATATVTMTVANALPTPTDDTIATGADTTIAVPVLGNDTDPNGDTLTVTGVTQGAHGAVTFTATGVTYDPDAGFAGVDTFDYTTSDGTGSATAHVSVTVNGPPAASADVATTGYDVTKAIAVLANDTDPNGDTLTVTGVTQGAHGAVTFTATGVTYDPDAGFSGADTFDYTVSDGHGGTATGHVTVTVANAPPVADDEAVTTGYHQAVDIPVLTGDTDPNGDTLTVGGLGIAGHGTVTLNGDGTVRYAPAAGFSGVDTFDYTVGDGHSGTDTGTVTVTVANGVPTAADDTQAVEVSHAQSIGVLLNDADPNSDPLTVTVGTPPSHGSVVVEANGSITYTPTANYLGTDSFTYSVDDGHGGTDTATVALTVSNTPPVAHPDADTTPTGTPVTVTVLGNDVDAGGDTLVVTAFTNGGNGTVSKNADESLTYTPAPGYAGPDTFTYTIGDGRGASSSATVTVTVQNAAPTAVTDSFRVEKGEPADLDVAANDTDPNTAQTLAAGAVVATPAHGTAVVVGGKVRYTPVPGYSGPDAFTYTTSDGAGGVSGAVTVTLTVDGSPAAVADTASAATGTPTVIVVLGNDTDPEGGALAVTGYTDPAHGMLVQHPDGSFTYTPDAGYAGPDTFTYTVRDPTGGTSTATVAVTVLNAAPIAADDAPGAAAGATTDLDVLANDTDPNPGQTLTLTGVGTPAHGTATVVGGKVRYTPAAGFSGTDTFTYTVSDGNGGTDTGTVTVTVTNAAPVASDDTRSTPYGTKVVVGVLGNDMDPNGDTLTVTGVTQPHHGTVTINSSGRSVSYTPPAGFSGVVTFAYTIDDGAGGTDTAQVTITVGAAPAVPDESTEADPGTPVSIGLPTKDKNGTPVVVVGIGAPRHGTAVLNADGTVTYTPKAGFYGTDTFTYTVKDANGTLASASITVTVKAPGSSPVAADDEGTTTAARPVVIDVLDGDTDPDGDALTVTGATKPKHGSVNVNPDGTVLYTPDDGFSGTDTFTYTVSDGKGHTDTATVTVTVSAADTLPRTGTDIVTIAEAGLLVLIAGAVMLVAGSRRRGIHRYGPGHRR